MLPRFDDLRIRTKLLLSFSTVLALTILVGGLAVLQLARVGGRVQFLASDVLPSVRLAAAMQVTMHQIREVQYAHMLSDSEQEQQALAARIQQMAGALQLLRKDYERLASTPQERAAYQSFVHHWDDYLKGNETAMTLTGDFGAKAMGGDYQKLFDATSADLTQIVKISQGNADAAAGEAMSAATRTQAMVVAAVAIAAACGFGLAFGMARRIGRPLSGAAASARTVAKGDLSRAIDPGGRDEIGLLLAALIEMQEGLRALVSTVRTGVDSMATASNEIAVGNADLSTRTERTASSLQQTASSMEQVTGTVKQTAESAHAAHRLASSASEVAQRGGHAVSEVVSMMEEISKSSKRIADITGVIDGLAFQTNLLALNAAVEAARAGEQGRGFAVVAGEVRGLAQRSADAAKEIRLLIDASVGKVAAGARLAQDAGRTMQDIVASVHRVSEMIAGITTAISEQSVGIGQVNTAISQLDHMTQQNAALVEQGAAAAESLKEQGHKLHAAVAAFQLP